MNYFEVAKQIVRMHEDWRQHGDVGTSAISRLPRRTLNAKDLHIETCVAEACQETSPHEGQRLVEHRPTIS